MTKISSSSELCHFRAGWKSGFFEVLPMLKQPPGATGFPGNDYDFQQATILSETDLHGTIIFVNDNFCDISKYAREELIGQPHKIIRHPDMPKKLFKILWETVQQGEVFRGIIKNRAKDGSHYWVNATIMPVTDQENKIIKYLGGRHHIADEKLARELFALQLRALNL